MKKLISITLAVLLSLSLFAATGFSLSDCGRACCCSSNMTDMQHAINYQAQIDGGCCSQVDAHPCGLMKNQNFELPMCTLSAGRINSGVSVGASVSPAGSSTVNEFILTQNQWPVAKFSMQSSPIYLQHLSLLI